MKPSDPVRTDPGRAEGFARHLFDGLPRRYDRQAQLLSLGQDRRWRRAMTDEIAAARPASVLDVATGPAGVALELARRTPAMITGLDLTPEMLMRGAANVSASPWSSRINLLVGRAERLPFADQTFDALTFTYLLRYVAEPAATLAELARVVKAGGTVASLEFHVPPARPWRAMWAAFTRAVLPVAGYLTGGREWFDVCRFLGPSISTHYRHYPLSWQVRSWQDAGINDVHIRLMSLGGGLVMWGRKA